MANGAFQILGQACPIENRHGSYGKIAPLWSLYGPVTGGMTVPVIRVVTGGGTGLMTGKGRKNEEAAFFKTCVSSGSSYCLLDNDYSIHAIKHCTV